MFAWASPSVVRAEFRAHGLDPASVELVRGSFDETLPGYAGTIALLHVDADLYESYRVTLSELWPRLAIGGVVAFDEYDDSAAWPGARRAVDEFLQSLPPGSAELRRDGAAGKSFAVKLA
jgi:predicted O-methyltransferase YrrM